jgi:hypothetical protein
VLVISTAVGDLGVVIQYATDVATLARGTCLPVSAIVSARGHASGLSVVIDLKVDGGVADQSGLISGWYEATK